MNEGTRAPVEPLNEALERLRLEGAIYLRAEYTERWALDGQGGPFFAAMMQPGAERLIGFLVVASGRCFVSTPDGERYWASAGEVIVLPYGDAFLMGGVEAVEPLSILSVVPPPPWTEMPIVRHGEGGPRTDVVCGFLYSEDPLFEPALKAFPLRSWSGRRPDQHGPGSTPASRMPSRNRQRNAGSGRPSCPRCCSSRSCACTSPTLPRPSGAGSPDCVIRCSRQR